MRKGMQEKRKKKEIAIGNKDLIFGEFRCLDKHQKPSHPIFLSIKNPLIKIPPNIRNNNPWRF
jgi:hypothetical protein